MPKKIKPPNRDGIKAGKRYAYLDLPEGMSECFFDLKLLEVKELESDNIACVFEVLDTDTKARVGSEINLMLYPFQRFAETYFWKEVYALNIVLRGKQITQKRIDKLHDNYKGALKALKNGDFVDGTCRCTISRYTGRDDQDKTARNWEPLESDDE